MEKISIKGNINASENKQIDENELFSLKIIDGLYKKDIVKFLEILSTNFIQKTKILNDLQIKTHSYINLFLNDNSYQI